MRTAGLSLAAALAALTACSGGSEGDNATNGQTSPSAEAPVNAADAEGEALAAIPAPFRGSWNFALDQCGVAASEGGLEVAADRITYYESVARVAGVTAQSPSTIMVEAEFSGEGESWTERLGYELNAEGDRLTTTTADGSVSVRMRCP